jgi:hypothetical protein
MDYYINLFSKSVELVTPTYVTESIQKRNDQNHRIEALKGMQEVRKSILLLNKTIEINKLRMDKLEKEMESAPDDYEGNAEKSFTIYGMKSNNEQLVKQKLLLEQKLRDLNMKLSTEHTKDAVKNLNNAFRHANSIGSVEKSNQDAIDLNDEILLGKEDQKEFMDILGDIYDKPDPVTSQMIQDSVELTQKLGSMNMSNKVPVLTSAVATSAAAGSRAIATSATAGTSKISNSNTTTRTADRGSPSSTNYGSTSIDDLKFPRVPMIDPMKKKYGDKTLE